MFEHLLDLCADNNIRVTISYKAPCYTFQFSTFRFGMVWKYKHYEHREFLNSLVNREEYWDRVFSIVKDELSEEGARRAILRQLGEE